MGWKGASFSAHIYASSLSSFLFFPEMYSCWLKEYRFSGDPCTVCVCIEIVVPLALNLRQDLIEKAGPWQ
jgi:hypothetical protein